MDDGCLILVITFILFFVIIPNIWNLVGLVLFLLIIKMILP